MRYPPSLTRLILTGSGAGTVSMMRPARGVASNLVDGCRRCVSSVRFETCEVLRVLNPRAPPRVSRSEKRFQLKRYRNKELSTWNCVN
jgi:hypothetical protein